MTSPVFVYDLTISLREVDPEFNSDWFIRKFHELAKKWVFQEEETEDGYNHLQCRISLHHKKRGDELKKLLVKTGGPFAGAHYSPTSLNGIAAGDFYCTKLDTRVAGPWKNTDEAVKDLVKPEYIPRQVRETPNLYPWQEEIVASKDVWDTRQVYCVVNKSGNIGKSTLVAHCRSFKHARVLPPVNDAKDLLRSVCDMPTSTMYLFDMPKAMNKERLYGFFQAVETLKDGYAYDDRYHFKEKIFDCPIIWIFTNKFPDVNLLSRDRWRFFDVDENKELVEVDSVDEAEGQSVESKLHEENTQLLVKIKLMQDKINKLS